MYIFVINLKQFFTFIYWQYSVSIHYHIRSEQRPSDIIAKITRKTSGHSQDIETQIIEVVSSSVPVEEKI